MKRIMVILLAVFLFLCSNIALAADALYRMLHADEHEEFAKDQDAVIVGQIVEDIDNLFNVKVLKCISGKVDSENILVEKGFSYAGFSEEKSHPAVDDFCVLSVKKFGEKYKIAWTAAKTDSGDYRTLKLVYEAKNFGGGDIPAIQWYINSGGTEKDFYFVGDKTYVKRPNGEMVDITHIAIELGADASDEQPEINEKGNDEENDIAASEKPGTVMEPGADSSNEHADINKQNSDEAKEEEVVETAKQQEETNTDDSDIKEQDEKGIINKENREYSLVYWIAGILFILGLAGFALYKLRKKQ